MQPIGMEMQAEVEMEQSAAAGSGAFAEGYAAAAESRKYWFDRKEILRTKRLYWMGRRAQDVPIFSQDRVGRDGKIFKFYKFRSMIPNAEARLKDVLAQNEMDGPVFKMKNDPRITRVGRFIRRTSIDELPQLINILKGDMSIVGPRPALPREVAQYTDYERQRLYVTPGLTCYWQIQPNRNELTFDEWMELDLKYIQDRNFWLDWKLIFQTIWAVLRMYGA